MIAHAFPDIWSLMILIFWKDHLCHITKHISVHTLSYTYYDFGWNILLLLLLFHFLNLQEQEQGCSSTYNVGVKNYLFHLSYISDKVYK